MKYAKIYATSFLLLALLVFIIQALFLYFAPWKLPKSDEIYSIIRDCIAGGLFLAISPTVVFYVFDRIDKAIREEKS